MTAPRVDMRRRGVRAIADASRESGAK